MYPVGLNLLFDLSRSTLAPPPHPSSPSLPPQNRSACPPSRPILIRIPRNRPEVRFCAELGVACTLGDAKVGRGGHPPNFVRASIEEEHKFGGWICRGGCGEVGSQGVGGGRDRRSSGGCEAMVGRPGGREVVMEARGVVVVRVHYLYYHTVTPYRLVRPASWPGRPSRGACGAVA